MAVNLVHQFGRERSRELLEQSFAQFQADKAVVGLARQLRKAEEALDGYGEAATCHLGDFMEYAGLRRRISDVEKARQPGPARRPARGGPGLAGAAAARRRDRGAGREVRRAGRGRRPGPLRRRARGRTSSPPSRQARRLAVIDFPTPVEAVTRLKIPKNFNGRNPQMRRDLASALRDRTHDLTAAAVGRDAAAPRRSADPEDDRGRPAARRAAGPPVPRLRGPRGPRPLGRALVQARPRRRARCGGGWSSAPTRWPASSTASARCSPRWTTSTATSVTDARPAADADLLRLDLVAAESLRAGPVGRAAALRAGGGAVGPGLRGPAARRRRRPAGARRARCGRPIGEMVRLWGRARRPRARPRPRLPPPARPGLRLGGLPLGRGRRPRRRARRPPTSPPATSCGG